MGSCEDAVAVHEPVHQPAFDQQQQSSCSEFVEDLGADDHRLPCLENTSPAAPDLNPTAVLDCSLGAAQNDNAGASVTPAHALTTTSVEDRVAATEVGNDNAVCLGPGNLMENGCQVSEPSLTMIHGGYVEYDYNGDTDGLCCGKVENDGWLNDEHVGMRDEKCGCVEMGVEEEIDSFFATEFDNQQDLLPSLGPEMPAEVHCLSREWSNVENKQIDSDPSTNEVLVVTDEEHVDIVGGCCDTERQNLSSLPSVFENAACMPPTCIQQDIQNDDQSVNSSSLNALAEVVYEKDDALHWLETTTSRQLSSQSCVESSKLILTLDSVQNVCHENDNKPAASSVEEGSEGIKENEHYPLGAGGSVLEGQLSSSLEGRICTSEVPLSTDCPQQIELDNRTISGLTSERIGDGESDASAHTEVDIGTWISPHGDESPPRTPSNSGAKIGSEKNANQENDKADISLAKIVRKGEEVCGFLHVLPSLACGRTLDYLPTPVSLRNCTLQNGKMNERNVDSSSAESTSEILEERIDTSTAKVEDVLQTFCVEGKNCYLPEGSPEIPTTVSIEKFSSPESCQPCDIAESGYSNRVEVQHPLVMEQKCSTKSVSTDACIEQIENEDKSQGTTKYILKNKCLRTQSAPARNSRACRSSRKTRSTKTTKKGKRIAQVLDFKKRKRSCLPKRTRACEWGLLGKVMEYFKVIDELGDDESGNCISLKERVGQASRKQSKSRAGGSSRKSGGGSCTLTTRIRLKVKVGKEVSQTILNNIVPKAEVVNMAVHMDAGTDVLLTESRQHVTSYISKINVDRDEVEQQKSKALPGTESEKFGADFDATVADAYYSKNKLEGTLFNEKSTENVAGDYLQDHAHIGVGLGASRERVCTGLGNSPESEVINLVPEIQVGAQCPQDMPDCGLASSKTIASSGLLPENRKGKKGKSAAAGTNKEVKSVKKKGVRQTKIEKSYNDSVMTSSLTERMSGNSSSNKESSVEQLHSSEETKLNVFRESSDMDFILSPSQTSKDMLPSTKAKGSGNPKKSDVSTKRRSKNSSSGKSRRSSSCKQKVNEKGTASDVDATARDPADNGVEGGMGKGTIKEDTGVANVGGVLGCVSVDDSGKPLDTSTMQHLPLDSAWAHCDDCHKWRRIPVELVQMIGENDRRWTCKDNMEKKYADCSIPQEKSNSEINAELGISDGDEDAFDIPVNNKGIENRQIVSKEHEFTRISTNQFLHRRRKTQNIDEVMVCHCRPPVDGMLGCGDECLNRMLNIECVHGTCPCGDLCSNQQFQRQTYANMRWDRCGKKGFGLRMQEDISKGHFLIEYVGEVLDMRAYEARQKEYAAKGHKHFYFMTLDGSEVIDACAKGNLGRFINHSCDPNCRTEKWVVDGEICIGLFALRNIKKDEELTFDYNYVRVFGAAAKKCYCGSAQCRGYIGGDPTNYEVIDQVDSDEEFPEPVMFDHRGKSLTKARSSAQTRITDSVSTERDKLDEDVESLGKSKVLAKVGAYRSKSPDISQARGSLEMTDIKANDPPCPSVETSCQAEHIMSNPSSDIEKVVSMEEPVDRSSGCMQASEKSIITTHVKLSTDDTVANKSKSVVEEKRVFVKSRFLIKNQYGATKKGKLNGSPQIVNKSQMGPNKFQVQPLKVKKGMEGVPNGRLETVEEKLNELLDVEGGITKRKDAAKGYLKLLLLTAASGAGVNGEGIQSNRDLSMILDAILKTKSRAVLIDIINKNGLQMLHNIMKRYRRDFKKIPIVRKLLKVIEYLAVREILTTEHIYGGPPRLGMESFRESMLSLTEHDDKQVHQIARSFRDKWFPRQRYEFRSTCPDKDERRKEFHRGSNGHRPPSTVHNNPRHDQGARPTEAVDCVGQSKVSTASSDSAVVQSEVPSSSVERSVNEGSSAPCSTEVGQRTRKRKSRWDQPAQSKHLFQKTPEEFENVKKEEGSCCRQDEASDAVDVPPGFSSNPVVSSDNSSLAVADLLPEQSTSLLKYPLSDVVDAPPGFSSNPVVASDNSSLTVADLLPEQSTSLLKYPSNEVVGNLQKKFNSCLPVSYGIPWHIVQRFGSPGDQAGSSWVVAPGIPFHPFPPLPPTPYPKEETRDCLTTNHQEHVSHQSGGYPIENAIAGTSGYNIVDTVIPCRTGAQAFNHPKGGSYGLGRKYFKQRKWNKRSQWNWRNEGRAHNGNNTRNVAVCSSNIAGGMNQHEHTNSSCSSSTGCNQ
ncbi:unnamed protein product [Linum tenue]|uniref:Histone-lysine N-methyltransferase ASHH2 n=1 Tax=Linum tenue TaxID=586396 RepID=A0AAV0RWQ1_9ROSI|nr:unnamed protein product [Linum tenue]